MCKCAEIAGKKCQGAECYGNVPIASVTFDASVIPHQLTLPLPIANRAHSTRRITLNAATMELPVVIIDYFASHSVYREWLVDVPSEEIA